MRMSAHPVTIDGRYEGPPGIVNGGYVCGIVAESLAGPVRTSLVHPVPVATSLELVCQERSSKLYNDESWP